MLTASILNLLIIETVIQPKFYCYFTKYKNKTCIRCIANDF